MCKVLHSKFCYQNLMIFIILCFHYHVPYWIFHLHPTIKFQEKFVCVWCASLLLLKPIELVCYLHHGMGGHFTRAWFIQIVDANVHDKSENKAESWKKAKDREKSVHKAIFRNVYYFLLPFKYPQPALSLKSHFSCCYINFFPSLKIYI